MISLGFALYIYCNYNSYNSKLRFIEMIFTSLQVLFFVILPLTTWSRFSLLWTVKWDITFCTGRLYLISFMTINICRYHMFLYPQTNSFDSSSWQIYIMERNYQSIWFLQVITFLSFPQNVCLFSTNDKVNFSAKHFWRVTTLQHLWFSYFYFFFWFLFCHFMLLHCLKSYNKTWKHVES